jgi:hypothetical protein
MELLVVELDACSSQQQAKTPIAEPPPLRCQLLQPCDRGKNGSIRRICASDSKNKSVMAMLLPAAIESTN